MPKPAEIDTHAAAANRGAGRARAIITGLRRTGRARRPAVADDAAEFLRLERRSAPGSFYWIARNGGEIRAGANFAEAEPLQPGFLDAMARAGAA